jgi:hypothetical protein
MDRRPGLLDRLRDSGISWRLLLAAACYAGALLGAEAVWKVSERAPLWSGLATDLLMLLIVAAVVDSVVARREQAKVDLVARIMYRSLAQLAFDGRRGLEALLTGTDLRAAGIPGWDDELVAGARDLLAANRDRLTAAGPLAQGPPAQGPPAQGQVDAAARGQRLAALLADHRFVVLLYRELSVFKRRVHDVTGQWAPVLLLTGDAAEDLNRMRLLADALGDLHQTVYHGAATVLPAQDWVAAPDWVRAVVDRSEDYLHEAEQARAYYHGLAEERRRLGQTELDAARAVTQQPPFYLESARRPGDGDQPRDSVGTSP